MQNKLLLPNRYKKVGWCMLIPATIMGLVILISNYEWPQLNAKVFAIYNNAPLERKQFFSFIYTNIAPTIAGVLFIAGALLVSFSKEKKEDEYIAQLRQSSLLWAVFVNYLLLLFSFLFIYGLAFLDVMLYNMFTILIIFIARFNYILYRHKSITNEEYN